MDFTIRHTPVLQLFAGEGDVANGETGDNIAVAGQDSAKETDPDAEFNQLINGKFKEQFTKKTQAIIDKRFKTTKELEAYKEKIQPVADSLYEKYNIPHGEIDLLAQAMERERAENGEKEVFSQETQVQDIPMKTQLRQKIGTWIKESKELQKIVPDFDLRSEIRSDKLFSQLLLSGLPLKTAYETVHRDEILNGAVAYTADKVRRQVVQGIQARGMRPVENGVRSEGAVVTTVDVNSLTSQDILKILKQVENGANVTF